MKLGELSKIHQIQTGYALPQTLPPELAAFCHRSKTTSPMGFAASEDEVEAVNPGDPPPQKAGSIKTFEDKRKDNFDRTLFQI
jgi:hypothetical protein